ncbi:MAG: hypothetical protein JWO86_3241 [Myxococcaceae bacterium]|nr:hypothetical protein [Myxococcaceae bacterium]
MTERAAARGGYERLARTLSMCVTIALLLAPATAHAKPTGAPADNRGWSNPRALELAKEAIEAKKEGNAQLCVEKDQASLQLEDHPYVKLHLASCLSAVGKLVDALGKAKDSLGAGIRNSDEDLQRSAQARVTELLPRIAHVKLLLPKESSGIKVTFDGVPVRQALFKQRIAVDPGDHIIDAERDNKGDHELFKERITLAEGDEKTIEIVLKPTNTTQSEIDCLQGATSYEEKLACVERKSSKPNVHVGLEGSGYTDSTSVHVFSPAINASINSPTQGWNVGASYLIDFVSAASPDIVSMASPAYKEARHAVAAGGGYKLGHVDLNLNGFLGSEPDYLARSIGGAISTELNDKLITPRFGYNFSSDRIGIRNTPFSQFERNLTTHELEAGITFVMSPTTLLVTGITAQFEIGENAKLYRYIPMFAPDVAPRVSPGESIDAVNANRLSVKSREFLPHTRNRFSMGARVNHRFSNGTLRVEERLYDDSWGIKASTTDAKYLHDLGDHLRVWPHLRYHVQSGTSFYKLAYPAAIEADGIPLQVFTYRTDDRELSPMMTVTAGGGARIALTTEKASVQYAIIVSGEVMYSRYFKSLYITARTGVYGTLGFEAEF